MAQPSAYKRQHDFTKDEQGEISTGELNSELDGASTSINEIRRNLALLQKDDGSLKNKLVGMENLTDDVVDEFRNATEDSAKQAATSASNAATSAQSAAGSEEAAAGSAEAAKKDAEAAAANALQTSNDRSAVNRMLEDMRPAINNADDIVIVARNINGVITVAGVVDSVNAVAAISEAVVEVHQNSANIKTVAASDTQVRTVSQSIADVRTVAGDLESSAPTGASISYGSITDPLQESQQTTGGTIKVVADNIESVRGAKGNADAAKEARNGADESAREAASARDLARRWALEQTTPIEGGAYGARYYAEAAAGSANAAGASAAKAASSEKAAGESKSAAQVSAQDAAASQDAAARSASAAKASETSAVSAAGDAEASAADAEQSATAAEESRKAAETAKTEAETSASNVDSSAQKAAESARQAAESAKQAAAGQIQADWNEKDNTSKAFIKNKPEAFTPSKHSHAIADVKGLEEKIKELEDNAAGADSVMLAQQVVGFYNGLTGSELDYREYVDAPPSELLNSLYSFGAGYQAAAASAT